MTTEQKNLIESVISFGAWIFIALALLPMVLGLADDLDELGGE